MEPYRLPDELYFDPTDDEAIAYTGDFNSKCVKFIKAPCWQDIETAPKDGTEVLTYERSNLGDGGWTDIGRYVADEWSDGKWYGKSGFIQPHYFMPLPSSPKNKGGEDG